MNDPTNRQVQPFASFIPASCPWARNRDNFDQEVGFSVGGFTVGHRASVGFTKAIATIVGIKDDGGRRKVTIEFDEPQPVDVPEGATARRFELDFRTIKSTWFEGCF